VIAESFERIHRSNLIGMGVLPLQFHDGENVGSLGLTGREVFAIEGAAGLEAAALVGLELQVTARTDGDDVVRQFTTTLRIDTPTEAAYFADGGILLYVARELAQV
jgi:aconitate hydratase